MLTKPQAEHQWLEQLVGEWAFQSECQMEPGQPAQFGTGHVSARSLGGMWLIAEGTVTHQGEPWKNVITLGYDPLQTAYVGTFIGTMMAQLWIYNGHLDSAQQNLALNSEGQSFSGDGTAQYRDIIEVVSKDHWTMRSLVQLTDGTWNQFMVAEHHRA